MKLNFLDPFSSGSHWLLADRYDIIKPLGTRGSERVYLARDIESINCPYCTVSRFSIPTRNDAEEASIRELFYCEAEVLQLVSEYDSVLPLLDHFEQDGEFYFVYEFIAGHTLDEELSTASKFSDEQTATLLEDILEALAPIHRQGVIHLDIRPSTLFRRDQDQKIILFGFGSFKQNSAQIISPLHTIETTSLFAPSPYMPDEQIAGHPKLSSDIYAVGLIALQAITGRRPNYPKSNFESNLVQDELSEPRSEEADKAYGQQLKSQRSNSQQAVESQWPSFASLRHPALVKVLKSMTDYSYRDRYQSADEALLAVRSLPIRVSSASSYSLTPTPELKFQPSFLRNGHSHSVAASARKQQSSSANAARQTAHQPRTRKLIPVGVGLALMALGTLVWRFSDPASFLQTANRVNADNTVERSISAQPDAGSNEQTNARTEDQSAPLLAPEQTPAAEGFSEQTPDSTTEQTSIADVAVAGRAQERSGSIVSASSDSPDNSPDNSPETAIENTAVDEAPNVVSAPREAASSSEESDVFDEIIAEGTNYSGAALTTTAAKATVGRFYDYVADRSWVAVRSVLNDKLDQSLEPAFFYRFKDVSVEKMRVVNQTPEAIDLMVENTYVYLDGSYQREERSYTVQMVNNQPTIVETAFEEVIKDRGY